jgi:phosphate transport system permease protein
MTTDAARARLRKRYRAETRFRLYGLCAIAVTAIFLAIVLSDIVIKGLPAFTQHYLAIDVTVDAAEIDPQGTRDPATLRAGDYQLLIRNALRGQFPEVTDRKGRRMLEGIVSSGAADDLRARVVADPSLVGRTITVAARLSDDADLYFKGTGTRITRAAGRGAARVTQEGDVITIESSQDDFAAWSGSLTADQPSLLVEINGGIVQASEAGRAAIKGEALRPLRTAEAAPAGAWQVVTLVTPQTHRRVSDREVVWLEALRESGAVSNRFNWAFFTSGDSREPELAGIRGALIGSALTLLVTLTLCLPFGVAGAIYLEEFAPKNRLTEFIEVNINNLAAVPSIVFGLLGLSVFLNFFGLPRSAPLVGGLVLALLVLPTIIIAARAALKAVPPSIKEAALGVGASHQQAIFHHVLPLAMPGIMTGAIIGMAHALGETAPLLMIGMVAFIVEPAASVTDAATVLPVQIYLWSDLPEIAFQAKTAAAIMVLLVFLFVMNGLAIFLRRRFERRW